MGRAIVRQPQCFLMDEPLSNLDAKLRVQTRTQIASLQRRLGTTTVYVTHDQVEAMTMGDRVALLKDGLLQQVDTPRHLYDKPENTFVAGFIGSPAMNLFDVQLTEQGACVGDYTLPIPRQARAELGQQGVDRATLGFRPESVEVVGRDQGFPFEVMVVEELGSDAYAYGNLHLGADSNVPAEKMFIARVDARRPPSKGETIHLRIRESEEHVFNPETGLRVGGASAAPAAVGTGAGAHRA
jgi:multiple sugar transport system ATP-binding protein